MAHIKVAMKTPTVRDIMTPAPRVVDATEDTRTARALMEQYGVRHLPVLHHGKLIGILSERDARAALAYLEHAPGELGPPVLAVCAQPPLVVDPDDPLDQVATQMANHRVGSALVVQRDRLVGIVSTVDLCRELAALIGRLRSLET